MTTIRKRRRYIPAEVEDAILIEARLGRTPAQIHKALDPRFPNFPTLRTVQRIVSEMPPETAGPWVIEESAPEHVPAVLAALHDVAVYSDGERLHLERREAERIARIAAAAPDIPPFAHFLLSHGDETAVQLFLAFSPWKGQHERMTYLGMILRRGIRVAVPVAVPAVLVNQANPKDFWEAVGWIWYEAEAFKGIWGKESGSDAQA